MHTRPIDFAQSAVETMMRKYSAADLPPKGRFHYHQGVFLSGVYKTYLLTKNEEYFDYVKAWVDSIIDMSGRVTKFDPGQLDDIQPGILLYPLYERTGDERYKKALDALCPIVYAFPRNKAGGFWHKQHYPNQMWLDGLYMGGPICAEYAHTFDKPEYFDLVAEQALIMQAHTRDERTGLMYHAWDETKSEPWADPETGLSPEFWGRAMGWVLVGVLDELDFIPENHPSRGAMRDMVLKLATALIKYQTADGRWYQVVDKPGEAGNWPENSCSCLYTAGICKGAYTGVLPESMLECAQKGLEGVLKSLSWRGEDLLIGNVCVGTGVGDYQHYIRRPTSENDLHGVGAFLLMCAEASRAGLTGLK